MRTVVTALITVMALSSCAQMKGLSKYNPFGKKKCCMKKMRKADTNRDGRVSLQEWKRMGAKKFRKIDRNRDGYISKSEMKKCGKGKKKRR